MSDCEPKVDGKPLWCSTPGTPCNCVSGPNNYQTICKPAWSDWTYPQNYSIRNAVTKAIEKVTAVEKSYEAHHVLCSAQVNAIVVGKKDDMGYSDILDKTQWCINAKDNMLAIPMWGHTIMFYCNTMMSQIDSVDTVNQLDASRFLNTPTSEPPFKDLPQHNYGHSGRSIKTSYNLEIGDHLETLVRSLQKDQEKHETERIKSLASKLTNASAHFKNELENVRGKRVYGGTHEAWKAGMKGKSDWYMPFSMAQEPRYITFPVKNVSGDIGAKIKYFARALLKLVD